MFIEIIVDGFNQPFIMPIDKAGRIGKELESKGKKFRLGKTLD